MSAWAPGEKEHGKAMQDLTETCRCLPDDELRKDADTELRRLEAAFETLQAAFRGLKDDVRDVVARAG